ncbi:MULTISPECIES: hypothetical protein [unclassified Acidovorax]|nr:MULTISPECIES: hypothetical protein [unclassified Acidovorax]OYY25874.1 MAG: hypothetical protein B7Y64_18005 [Acidovorax sp. 35-64-16]OZA57342.1 MAG: hypothetical protein B7X79_07085 [Acidovorax sp. 17-64-282]HQT51024.1 hypothetical protein [Acidovorax defluvii]OYY84910.1 MAG: hypothetical protein B7Y46_11340 [Acidovorax sp. 28-64-14]OZA67024.1 MAG: hypothetical protein B7X70_18580 [Acidovorax sp. 39-64-12]
MQSVISYPDRGHWGDPKWRGNCSGRVYQDLFDQLQPKTFADPMVGSGTSVEVAKEMGIQAWGLDLHSGFNAIADSILLAVGQQVDLCVSHPPYGSMIKYSGSVWGSEPHPGDLSHCSSNEEFHEKMQLVLLNQRDATKPQGFYGTIIGDYRKAGTYTSYQAEMIARMPSSELAAVIIKQQHNCVSDARSYAKLTLPRIQHEYILLWQKKSAPILMLLGAMAKEQYARLTGTWKSIVGLVMQRLGGKANLDQIYHEVSRAAPNKLAENPNWKAKIRQVLNSTSLFRSSERGVWMLAA